MPHTPPKGTPKSNSPEPPDAGSHSDEAEPIAKRDDIHRLLVESVRDYAIFALDPAGRVLTWSAGAARMKGYGRTEIIGQHFSIFYPREAIAEGKPERELEIARHTGRLEDEGWRVRKDGSKFWANVIITALHDELGDLVGFAKVTRDLTARRLDEENLRRSEERFRLLVESVRDYAIFMLDPEGYVATWNAGAERIKGYRASEIVGRHFSVFYPEEKVAERFPEFELETAAREGHFEDEGWRVRKNGSQFWANVVITALRDRTGQLVGFAKVTRDLTERRAAEEAVRRLAAEASARAAAERRTQELQQLTDQLQEQAIEIEQQREEALSLAEIAEAAERRVAFLAEASARLASSLDVEATLTTIADLAVPALADWCFVEVLERGRVRPAAVRHSNPQMVQLAREVLTRYPIDLDAPFGTGKVLRLGQSELNREIQDDVLRSVAQDEEHLNILRRVGFRSSLSVPLKDVDGRSVAVLSLVASDSGRRFAEGDLALAEEVARRAGAALARATLFAAGQAALRRATALQKVSSALVSALSGAEVGRVIVEHGREAVGAAAGSLALYDGSQRVLRVIATVGYSEATAAAYREFPLVPGRPVSDAIIRDAAIYEPSLTSLDAEYPYAGPVLQGTGFEAFVALPVRVGQRPAGGLSFSFTEQREFDAEDRAFLETLAAQAGQALDRARLVEAERAARMEAEEANRAKSEFLATMSHELRTPLNAIAGYADLMEMGIQGPLTADQRESLLRIKRSQLHLTGLINEVLNYARLEGGAVTYDIRPIALADVVGAAVPLVEPQRSTKAIALEVRLADRGKPSVRALADPEKVQQILLNLLANAIRFTAPGGMVTVEVPPEPNERGMAEVRVADTGIGIPNDRLEAIFEPFVQIGRSLRNPGEGTGLGLAISRDLARAMGGDIRARSEVGRGSVFTLELPREDG